MNLRIGSHPALLLRHFTMRHFWSLVPLLVSGGTIGAWWHYWCLVPLLVPGGTIGPWCHYWSLVPPLVPGATIGPWWHHWSLVPLLVPGGTIGPWWHQLFAFTQLNATAVALKCCYSINHTTQTHFPPNYLSRPSPMLQQSPMLQPNPRP